MAPPVRSSVLAIHITPINTRVITHELLEGHLPFRENGEYSIVKAARCKLELPYPYWEVISGEGSLDSLLSRFRLLIYVLLITAISFLKCLLCEVQYRYSAELALNHRVRTGLMFL